MYNELKEDTSIGYLEKGTKWKICKGMQRTAVSTQQHQVHHAA